MRILLAEDERITRASLARQLAAWGHEVTAAEDGQHAWQAFTDSPFDLVITDWEMPNVSGLELVRRIRGAANAGFVYVLMLTSRTDKADVVQGIESGADDFVSKPFDREELRVRLLAGERIIRLERTLSRQNDELRAAGERMRNDLRAASEVQRAMLPQRPVVTPAVKTAWKYIPTEELAGDAIGLHLLDDRYLVAYVLDVSGHGVPAALLSVSAMHELSPLRESSVLRGGGDNGAAPQPGRCARDLNQRFRSDESAGRFLTMILCVLDTRDGLLRFASAGHFLPLVLRGPDAVPVIDVGGLPLAVIDDSDYEDGQVQLQPGDRVYLYSDGIIEQSLHGESGAEQFGAERFQKLLVDHASQPADVALVQVVTVLENWAGSKSFTDDASLVAIEWLGNREEAR